MIFTLHFILNDLFLFIHVNTNLAEVFHNDWYGCGNNQNSRNTAESANELSQWSCGCHITIANSCNRDNSPPLKSEIKLEKNT